MREFLDFFKLLNERSTPLSVACFLVSGIALFVPFSDPSINALIVKYREPLFIMFLTSAVGWLSNVLAWLGRRMRERWDDYKADQYDEQELKQLGIWERVLLAELWASRNRCQIYVAERSETEIIDTLISKGFLYARHNQVCVPKKLWELLLKKPWSVANFDVLLECAIKKGDYLLALEIRKDRQLVRESPVRMSEECAHMTVDSGTAQGLENRFLELKQIYDLRHSGRPRVD